MADIFSEKQPLTAPIDYSIDSQSIETKQLTQRSSTTGSLLDVSDIKQFLKLADNIIFNIEESQHCMEKIQDAQKQVYEHAAALNDTARKNRSILEKQTLKTMDRLNFIRQNIYVIDPSKPNLTELDIRNQRFKFILRSFKDFLEKYINLVLESQRFISVLFENQIRQVNPNVTSPELEKVMNSTMKDSPSVYAQILMQQGVKKNDKATKLAMHAVQDIHEDLRQLNLTFTKLSEIRNEVNIAIERYRRRWPIAIRQGDYVYVIDDDLNLLEKTIKGTAIDFDLLLRQRERRNRLIAGFITVITIVFVISLVVSTALFSDF